MVEPSGCGAGTDSPGGSSAPWKSLKARISTLTGPVPGLPARGVHSPAVVDERRREDLHRGRAQLLQVEVVLACHPRMDLIAVNRDLGVRRRLRR